MVSLQPRTIEPTRLKESSRSSVEMLKARQNRAAELGAREPELVPQRPQQRRVGGDIDAGRLAVDVEVRHVLLRFHLLGGWASQPDGSRLGAAPMNPMMLTYLALALPYLVATGRVVLALGAWTRWGIR